MSDYTKLDMLGAVGSAIGILGALMWLFNTARKYKAKRKADQTRTDAEFEEQFEQYNIAGKSIDARSDLAVYVNLELSRQYAEIDRFRHFHTLQLMFLIAGCASAVVITSDYDSGYEILVFLLVATLATLAVNFLLIYLHIIRMENCANAYSEKALLIWQKPVEKRFN